MDLVNNSNIDKTILICNVTSIEADYLDLLFENEKRSGGGEIVASLYDEDLKQFMIIYKNIESVENVMKFGLITRKDRAYRPYLIDKNRILINVTNLVQEVVLLLAENMLTNSNGITPEHVHVNYLNDNYAIISINEDIDFNKAIKKYTEYRSRYKDFQLYLAAKIDENADLCLADLYSKNVDRLNENQRKSPTNITVSNSNGVVQPPIVNGNAASGTNKPLTDSSRRSSVNNCTVNGNGEKKVYESVKYRAPEIEVRSVILSQDESSSSSSTASASTDTGLPVSYQNGHASNEGSVINLNEKNDLFTRLKVLEARLGQIETLMNKNQTNRRLVANSEIQTISPTREPEMPNPLVIRESQRDNPFSMRPSTRNRASAHNVINEHDTEPTPFNLHHHHHDHHSQYPTGSISRVVMHGNSNVSNPPALHNLLRRVSVPRQSLPINRLNAVTSAGDISSLNAQRNSRLAFLDAMRDINNNGSTDDVTSSSTADSGISSRGISSHIHALLGDPQYPGRYTSNAVRNDGISKALIDRFPIINYKKPTVTRHATNPDDVAAAAAAAANGSDSLQYDDEKCSICLESYEQNENLRVLCCLDKFHVKCIDRWLSKNRKCPCCKYDILDYLTKVNT